MYSFKHLSFCQGEDVSLPITGAGVVAGGGTVEPKVVVNID